jgi:hypothetical protein
MAPRAEEGEADGGASPRRHPLAPVEADLSPSCNNSVALVPPAGRRLPGVLQGKFRLFGIAILLGLAAFGGQAAGLGDVRGPLEQWVQVRQTLARTRADWLRDKEMLGQSLALLQRELATVRDQSAKLDTNFTVLAEQRAAATVERDRYQAAVEVARSRLGELEARLKKLAAIFPPVLLTTVQPLLNRFPADPAATNVALVPRVQALVTLLNEVDKFNAAVTTTEETRTTTDGRAIAVTVVYLGLGQAWFVNQAGDFAGTGVPGPSGWEWTVRNELAPQLTTALKMYRNELPAEFVALPVQIR